MTSCVMSSMPASETSRRRSTRGTEPRPLGEKILREQLVLLPRAKALRSMFLMT